ncbi:glycerol dehydrogenase [Desulfogranum marinum]|uniref:glycerol dehydrogenase n=1 Tax=Desulfogranum marinum TaxID=453220 RepID=UPI0029C7D1FD|nr:glycerol dehydrogenase [Desulfogranum marinum]
MSRMLLAPNRYVQGAGAISEIGEHVISMGSKALITGGKTALETCGEQLKESLTEKGLAFYQETFAGECSNKEIQRLVSIATTNECKVVIAVGGGKVIDTGKAVAHEMSVPVVVVPTIAATDAPCSALSVIYTDDGVFERYLVLPKNPDCVLVDTLIVAQAPESFLVSGMGDALATYWEADTCAKSCAPNALTGATPPTLSAQALARLCYDTLLEHGHAAKLAVKRNVVTSSVEAVVEANTLLSGIGFESGGLAGAHSIHNGFTVLEASHGKLHGEKVAFGTLTQLVLEGRPQEQINEVMSFCVSIGLPVSLKELGLSNPSKADIKAVAEATTAEGETIHSTWFPVTAAAVEAAIWTADALGEDFLNKS